MISEIITTYLISVRGSEFIPSMAGQHCECVKHSKSTECEIGFVIDNGDILNVVTTSINGRPVNDEVLVVCRQ